MENWRILNRFARTFNGEAISFIDSPISYPEGVEEAVRKSWNLQLRKKQNALKMNGVNTEIKPYHLDKANNPLNALYEGKQTKMWPGPVVSLQSVLEKNEGINLLVAQTSFPFIAALKDEKISNLYESREIEKPRPSLAICTYALTLDDKLVLTVRGERTNMYPRRFYGQGGNPLYTNTNIVEHQIDEMQDEILVNPKDYNPSNFVFGGLIEDREDFPEKPDLIGWVPVNLEYGQIKERVRKRAIEERPNDSIDVTFVPATKHGLHDYLSNINPKEFCPSALGGLFLYEIHNFG